MKKKQKDTLFQLKQHLCDKQHDFTLCQLALNQMI